MIRSTHVHMYIHMYLARYMCTYCWDNDIHRLGDSQHFMVAPTHICMHTCTPHVHIYPHTHTHTYTHTHTHTHIHTHTYTGNVAGPAGPAKTGPHFSGSLVSFSDCRDSLRTR